MPKETEFVKAGDLREGDVLPKYGTVIRILNDSTLLSVDTSDPPYGFMKSQHAPVERYVRNESQVYGLDWLRQQPKPEPTCAGSILEERSDSQDT